MPVPPVTVSVVTHGQWSLVRPLLEQLDHWCAGVIDRVVLTVNLPEPEIDTTGLRLVVLKIDNPEPKGFGANHNAAFRHCRTPWFLILNPDIRLDHDALSALLQVAQPGAGLVAPRIHEPHKPSVEPYRDLPTPAELVRRRFDGYRPPGKPAWVAGMFMLVRQRAFAAVQGFDESFFMYCEDVDLCVRLQLGGWTLQVVERVVVQHEAQRASNRSLQPLLWHVASLLRLWTRPSYRRMCRELARAADAGGG